MATGVGTIFIARSHVEAVVAHARNGSPDEVCGVVAIRDGTVVAVVPTRNAAATPRNRFEIDSRDLMRVVEIERDRLDVGFYHSHPVSVAYPSATDIGFAELWPGALQLMVSLRHDLPDGTGPEFHAYRIFPPRVDAVDLIIDESR